MAALAFLDTIDNGEQDASDANQARSSAPSESGSSRADSVSPVQNARAATPLRNLAAKHCPGCERNMGDSSLTPLPIAGYEDEAEDELKIVAGRSGYCKRCHAFWRVCKQRQASLGVTTQLLNDGDDERWGWDLDFAIYTILTRTQKRGNVTAAMVHEFREQFEMFAEMMCLPSCQFVIVPISLFHPDSPIQALRGSGVKPNELCTMFLPDGTTTTGAYVPLKYLSKSLHLVNRPGSSVLGCNRKIAIREEDAEQVARVCGLGEFKVASPASLAIVPLQQSVATREESKMASMNNMIYNVFTDFTSEDWENVKEADFTSPIKKVNQFRSAYASIKGLPS